MTRRLLNLLTALSLAIFLVAFTMWARSHFAQDSITWTRRDGSLVAIRSAGKRLYVATVRDWPTPRRPTWRRFAADDVGEQAVITAGPPTFAGGFDVYVTGGTGWFGTSEAWHRGPPRRIKLFTVGWDTAMWLGAAVPSLRAAAHARRRWSLWRRRATGLCPSCGYDLRATPGRCPECGRPATGG